MENQGKAKEIDVATFNLQQGFGRGNEKILNESVDIIEKHKPDILALQEIFKEPGRFNMFCGHLGEIGYSLVEPANVYPYNIAYNYNKFNLVNPTKERPNQFKVRPFDERGHGYITAFFKDLVYSNKYEFTSVHQVGGIKRKQREYFLAELLLLDTIQAGDFNPLFNEIDFIHNFAKAHERIVIPSGIPYKIVKNEFLKSPRSHKKGYEYVPRWLKGLQWGLDYFELLQSGLDLIIPSMDLIPGGPRITEETDLGDHPFFMQKLVSKTVVGTH